MFKRFISVTAAVLATALLLSGCTLFEGKCVEGDGYLEGQRLTVEEIGYSLSDDERKQIAINLTDTVSYALLVSDGIAVDENERGKIREYIEDELVIVIEESEIDFDSFCEANGAIRRGLTLIEEGNGRFGAFRDIYYDLTLGLGSEKSGALIYKSALVWLDYREEHARKRYESYGYEWYLKDAEDFSRLSREMRGNLDEKEFSDALGVLFFSSAIMGGTITEEAENIGIEADGEELKVLLRMQRESLEKHSLDVDDWQTVGEIVFKAFFENSDIDSGMDELKAAELIALRDCPSYSRKIAGLTPYFIDLYTAVISLAEADDIDMIISGGDGAKRSVVGLVTESYDELCALLDSIMVIQLSSSVELEAIEAAGYADEFEEYSQTRKKISSEELFEVLVSYSEADADDKVLGEAVEDLLFGQAPYITFAFFFEGDN